MGPHVEKAYDVVAHNQVHPLVGFLAHSGFQEHTHSSPTPWSPSLESFSEVSASTLNDSTAANNQEDPVKDFKRLVDLQKGFYDLSLNSLAGQPDDFENCLGN